MMQILTGEQRLLLLTCDMSHAIIQSVLQCVFFREMKIFMEQQKKLYIFKPPCILICLKNLFLVVTTIKKNLYSKFQRRLFESFSFSSVSSHAYCTLTKSISFVMDKSKFFLGIGTPLINPSAPPNCCYIFHMFSHFNYSQLVPPPTFNEYDYFLFSLSICCTHLSQHSHFNCTIFQTCRLLIVKHSNPQKHTWSYRLQLSYKIFLSTFKVSYDHKALQMHSSISTFMFQF